MSEIDVAATFNAVEAVWWWVVAAVVARPSFEPDRLRAVDRWTLVLAFAAFGVSDVIEYFTGAWWRPRWLLVLKVGCIAAFITAVVRAVVRGRRDAAATISREQ